MMYSVVDLASLRFERFRVHPGVLSVNSAKRNLASRGLHADNGTRPASQSDYGSAARLARTPVLLSPSLGARVTASVCPSRTPPATATQPAPPHLLANTRDISVV